MREIRNEPQTKPYYNNIINNNEAKKTQAQNSLREEKSTKLAVADKST